MIPAGRSGKLVAKVHTSPTQNGRLSKSITVATDAPGAKSLRLTLSFKAESVIEIRPRARLYVHGIAGSPLSTRVLMHRTDGEALEITGIRFEDPDLNIEAVPVDPEKSAEIRGAKPAAGDVWLEASVQEGVQVGNRNGTAWITTNHPKMREMQMPYSVRIRPVLEARPNQVRLWISDTGTGPKSTMFRLTHNGGASFEVKGVKIADEKLVTVTPMSEGKSLPSHNLKVELHESVAVEDLTSVKNTKLVVMTSDDKYPEITIPVTIQVRQTVRRSVPASPPQPQFNSQKTSRPLPTGTPNVRPLPTGTPNAKPLKPEGEKD